MMIDKELVINKRYFSPNAEVISFIFIKKSEKQNNYFKLMAPIYSGDYIPSDRLHQLNVIDKALDTNQ